MLRDLADIASGAVRFSAEEEEQQQYMMGVVLETLQNMDIAALLAEA